MPTITITATAGNRPANHWREKSRRYRTTSGSGPKPSNRPRQHAANTASPPSRATGAVWTLRSPGMSSAFTRNASHRTAGVSASERRNPTRNSRR